MSHLVEILNLYGFSDIELQNLLLALETSDCHIKIEESTSINGELEALNESLQSCFLRPQGTERQQLNDKFNNEEISNQLIPLLSPFINSIKKHSNLRWTLAILKRSKQNYYFI